MIDIATTPVTNSAQEGARSTLSTLIHEIGEQQLVLRTGAKFGDGTNEAEFDFEFDDETGKFGTGTAFLAEE